MGDDFPRRIIEQIEPRTASCAASTTNEEGDEHKGDNDDRRCSVKIQIERQWQVVALAKAVRARRRCKRARAIPPAQF